VCRVVADSLEAGLPLDAALRHAGELPVGHALRWRLVRWAGGIERGMPVAEAARRASMPKMIAGLVTTGQGDQARETFAFLARYYGTRFHRFEQLIRGAAIPAMVFFFATIVTFVSLGLFVPIIALITFASPYRNSL
jgi:type II secretory pathway component PulF